MLFVSSYYKLKIKVMKTKHTEGNWEISGRRILSQDVAICSVFHSSMGVVGDEYTPGKKESEANAKLIASAPKMLEALIEICDYFDAEQKVAMSARCLINGLEVIEKATG